MEINMPTTLNITNMNEVNVFKRLFKYIIPNPPKIEEKKVGEITLKSINYKVKNSKIPWKKISNIIRKNSKYVLCSENIKIPITYGIQRFTSNKLNRCLCENTFIAVLKNLNVKPTDFSVSLYDPRAAYADILDAILQYSAQVKAVSNNIRFYEEESARLMERYGVTVLTTDNILSLNNSDIIVAPDKIRTDLKLSKDTFVFTAEEPGINLGCTVIDGYKVNTPIEYKPLIPNYIEDEYLLSYLYSELKVYELSDLVPVYCISEGKAKTIKEISEELETLIGRV